MFFYIQNKHAGYLGNAPTWYGKNGKGYTAYILGAHRFPEDEAKQMVAEDPDKWAMYPCKEIDQRLHLVFDSQDFPRLGTDQPCGWSSGYAAQQMLATTLENYMLKLALGYHQNADAYASTFPEGEEDRKALSKSETWNRLKARSLITDALANECNQLMKHHAATDQGKE